MHCFYSYKGFGYNRIKRNHYIIALEQRGEKKMISYLQFFTSAMIMYYTWRRLFSLSLSMISSYMVHLEIIHLSKSTAVIVKISNYYFNWMVEIKLIFSTSKTKCTSFFLGKYHEMSPHLEGETNPSSGFDLPLTTKCFQLISNHCQLSTSQSANWK